MIQTAITDPQSRFNVKVGTQGEVFTTMHTHPPLDESIISLPFSNWFENNGSNDMKVNGSVTPVLFSVNAVPDFDIYIKTVSVRISDAAATLDKFGGLAALTNGISFVYITPRSGEIVIQDEIKTNLSFIRIAQNTLGIGGGNDAFKADINGGGADTYLPVINMTETFGFPWGLHLKKGSLSTIGFYVKDNVAGLDEFNIKAFGIKI